MGAPDSPAAGASHGKRPGRGRLVASIALYVLTAALLAGAWAVDHFTHAKMGMARHMVYMRSKWSAALPLDGLRVAAVVLVAAVCVLAVVRLVRRRAWRRPAALVAVTLAVVLATAYGLYTLGVSPQTVRAHILVSPLLGLAALVQGGNALLTCRTPAQQR